MNINLKLQTTLHFVEMKTETSSSLDGFVGSKNEKELLGYNFIDEQLKNILKFLNEEDIITYLQVWKC